MYVLIIENEKNVGFIMLEKLNEDYPYYIDFFAIFEKYQGNNYGTMALEYLIKNIIKKMLNRLYTTL